MRHVFGPVPSRRLGRSLGVDTVPLKTCNWNCVYCQLGRTIPLVHQRREWIPRHEILNDLEIELASHPADAIDWVTFVASGETTLHRGLGWMIERARQLTDLPVAVITNGSLLYMPEVRDELRQADAVLPSLDAGDATLFRRVNRPHPQATHERLVQGLIDFRDEYRGKFWVEVMLVGGLNDDEKALHCLAAALTRVRADAVHINLPTRPPAEAWVGVPGRERLVRACEILGTSAEIVQPAKGTFELREDCDVISAILEVITRHPMRLDEVRAALARRMSREGRARHDVDLEQVFTELEASGQARRVVRHGTSFLTSAGVHFGEEKVDRRPPHADT